VAAGGHTNEHSEELTFGRLLVMLRTQKGLDLEAISGETKIAVSTLRLLEEEAYDKLPDTVFVKGFLKAYAQVVDTSPDTIIQSFLAGRHHYNENLRYEAGLAGSKRSAWPWWALAVGLLSVILYAAISNVGQPTAEKSPETNAARPQAEAPAASDLLSETDIQRPGASPEPETGYLLQIKAVEETWLKIIVDRKDPKAYLLNPGDSLELKASIGFNLLIGNATGVNMQLNHQPVSIDGKHGQVVTRKLP
jgi:transcriptional regulator with XRE-family HTH domain